jgi:hypothetical protein
MAASVRPNREAYDECIARHIEKRGEFLCYPRHPISYWSYSAPQFKLGVMTKYVEPTLRARQLFFLYLIGLGAFMVLADRLDELLPPISDDLTIAFDQILERTLVAAVLSTIFYAGIALAALHYARRALRSGRWPPEGMAVPFRTPIKEIRRPWKVWVYLAVLFASLAALTAMPWQAYSRQQAYFQEVTQIIESMPPNNTLQRDAAKRRAP